MVEHTFSFYNIPIGVKDKIFSIVDAAAFEITSVRYSEPCGYWSTEEPTGDKGTFHMMIGTTIAEIYINPLKDYLSNFVENARNTRRQLETMLTCGGEANDQC